MVLKILLNGMLFMFLLSAVHAQSSFSSTGGDATGTGGSVSFSVGQVVYTSHSASVGSVIQGVQQPYEISVISGIDLPDKITLSASVHPNPTSGNIYLSVMNANTNKLVYQLYQSNGSSIENKKIVSDVTTIDLSNLTPATYYLKVIDGSKEIKTFKIIKN